MARPLRIEFSGAVYHVTSRGDRREPIFVDDVDRTDLLSVVEQGMTRFDAQVLAYCLMGNHYHFVLHTRQPNLSLLMRHINGVYTQLFNRRHGKVGHLFQGRFKAVLVDRDAYLLEVCRYVELNPVRAGMVADPGAWPWSSYGAHVGAVQAPTWLDVDGLHGYVLERDAISATDHRRAAQRYATLVASAPDIRLWDEALRQQIYLGDEAFVQRMHAKADETAQGVKRRASLEIPKAQRQKPIKLEHWLNICESRQEAIYRAYTEGAQSMSAIAQQLNLSVSRISRLIADAEKMGSGYEPRSHSDGLATSLLVPAPATGSR